MAAPAVIGLPYGKSGTQNFGAFCHTGIARLRRAQGSYAHAKISLSMVLGEDDWAALKTAF